MNWDVFCDESRHELLVREVGDELFVLLGSLWLPRSETESLKKQIKALRTKHSVWSEFKWTKVSPSKLSFYEDLVDLFFKLPELRFRSIAIKTERLDLATFHNNDSDLGYYKFFYQLLHHRIEFGNTYRIFLDYRSKALNQRNRTLQRTLGAANKRSNIEFVQALRSHDSDFLQLCDLLLGATQAKLNKSIASSEAKTHLIERIETHLGKPISKTRQSEVKFNIFEITLR